MSTPTRSEQETGAPAGARWLYGAAAVFNLGIGVSLLLFRAKLGPLLDLDPIAGTNLVTFYLVAGLVVMFGYVYILIASDPIRYRPYVRLGIISKLIAVIAAGVPWLAGAISWKLPLVTCGDLMFAALFLLYLRRVPARNTSERGQQGTA